MMHGCSAREKTLRLECKVYAQETDTAQCTRCLKRSAYEQRQPLRSHEALGASSTSCAVHSSPPALHAREETNSARTRSSRRLEHVMYAQRDPPPPSARAPLLIPTPYPSSVVTPSFAPSVIVRSRSPLRLLRCT